MNLAPRGAANPKAVPKPSPLAAHVNPGQEKGSKSSPKNSPKLPRWNMSNISKTFKSHLNLKKPGAGDGDKETGGCALDKTYNRLTGCLAIKAL